jgi:hypothetical protein
MGFFSVSSLGAQTRFKVEAAHLTLWVLPKHWSRLFWFKGFDYFFDVGLRLTEAEGNLRRIRVTVPFDSAPDSLSDLSSFILDSEFAPLVFGKPVAVDGNTINYDGSALGQGQISDSVVPISVQNSAPVQEMHPRFSVWNLELQHDVRPGENAYVRFRFAIKSPNLLWNSKGWGYAKRGYIADLRVADVRETTLLGLGRPEAEHVMPVSRLFLFLGAPAYFVPQHMSPQLHYSRLLEPKVWKKYLGAVYGLRPRISIHQWRSEGAGTKNPTPVDLGHPYRAYMDVTREFGPSVFVFYFLGAAAFPLTVRAWDWFWASEWVASILSAFIR